MRSIAALTAALLLAGIVGASVPQPAMAAQPWPTRPVTFVVPFPPGGSNDGIGRVIAKELGDRLGQTFVVENKGGASGNIAAVGLAHARPDGYTLMIASNGPAVMNKLMNKSLAYDPIKDFVPIIVIGIVPQVIIASPKIPAKTLPELMAYAKSQPGKINFGNSGYGTMAHIAAVSLARTAGLDVAHVNYRGSAPLITDVMGGQIEAGFPGFVPQVIDMKTLAVTSQARMDILPNVPTVRETGVADLVAGTWFALVAPAKTPPDILEKVNATVRDYMASDAGKKFLRDLGMQPIGGSSADAKAYIAAEAARWAPLIRETNMVMSE
jgi:tripartite-type tricarboxylate transporter receptor subunit TctC